MRLAPTAGRSTQALQVAVELGRLSTSASVLGFGWHCVGKAGKVSLEAVVERRQVPSARISSSTAFTNLTRSG